MIRTYTILPTIILLFAGVLFSAANAAQIEVIGKHLRADGSLYDFEVVDGDALSPGDRFQIVINADQRLYYAITYLSRDGKATQIFPQAGKVGYVNPGQTRFIPGKDNFFTLDINGGRELMFVVTSPKGLSNLPAVLRDSEKVKGSTTDILAYMQQRLDNVKKLEITNTGKKIAATTDQISSSLARDIAAIYARNPWPDTSASERYDEERVRQGEDNSIPEAVRRRAAEVRSLMKRPKGTSGSSSLRTVQVSPSTEPKPAIQPEPASSGIQLDSARAEALQEEIIKREEEERLKQQRQAEDERKRQEQMRAARLASEAAAEEEERQRQQRLAREAGEEEARRLEAEKLKREEEERLRQQKLAEEERKRQEELRAARLVREAAEEEARRLQAEREEAERLEAQRIAEAEAKAKELEEQRLAMQKAEEEARLQAELRAEQERKAAEEKRVKEELLAQIRAEEEAKRRAEEKAEAERKEVERLALEEARKEQERLAREKAEAERIRAARLEAERLEAEARRRAEEEARRVEEERLAAEKARQEEERRLAAEAAAEAERKREAERLAAEEAARLEAERRALAEAEAEARLKEEARQRAEAERLAKQQAEEEARRLAEIRAAEEAAKEAEEARRQAEIAAEEARILAEQEALEEQLRQQQLAEAEARRKEEERQRVAAAELAEQQAEAAASAKALEKEKSGGLFDKMLALVASDEKQEASAEAPADDRADTVVVETDSTGEVILNESEVVSQAQFDDSNNVAEAPPQAVVVLQAPIRPAAKPLTAPAPERVVLVDDKSAGQPAAPSRNQYAQIASAIVSIKTANDPQASGFILDSKGHILTGWHVINNVQDIDVSFMGVAGTARAYKAKVIKYNKFNDLALLKLVNPPEGIQPITVAPNELPDAGSTVRVFGQKDGKVWATDDAVITRIAPHFTWFSSDNVIHRGEVLQVDLPAEGRDIGSLVTTMDYQMLGVKSFSGSQTGRTYAVSVRMIRDFIESGSKTAAAGTQPAQ